MLASERLGMAETFTPTGGGTTERFYVECRPGGNQTWQRLPDSLRRSVRQAAVLAQNAARKRPGCEFQLIRITTIKEVVTL